jgi:hypothetical protein
MVALLQETTIQERTMIFAYIDPGTGSLLLQAVLGGLAGVGVFFRTLRHRYLRRKAEPAETTQL